MATYTEAGISVFVSRIVSEGTEKLPSAAGSILDFYRTNNSNEVILTSSWKQVEGMKPSAIDNETFFLGFRTTKIGKCSNKKHYKNEIGVIIVDIIPDW